MKIKIIDQLNNKELMEKEINDFIKDKKIISICSSEYYILILYEDNLKTNEELYE